MAKLILLRHGESLWNKKNRFTGWVDLPLSKKGIQESLEAGKKIKDLPIDIIFTSTLVRAQMTVFLALSEHSSNKVPVVQHEEGKLKTWAKIYDPHAQAETIPVFCSWHLNERMYGELQGLNKAEVAQKFGEKQLKLWRRSYDVAPPGGESLAMTAARTIPYFTQHILPHIQAGKNVFIGAHGNSLRSICMHLDNLSEEEVLQLELATGDPIIYNYQNQIFQK